MLAVSSGALEEQKNVIEAAAKAGVRRVVPSEFGSVCVLLLLFLLLLRP